MMNGWSNFLQNPQDFSRIAPMDRSIVPVIKPNLSMSAPQIQGGINAPMQNIQPKAPGMDPAQMMSLMGRFGMPQTGQQQQMPQMPAGPQIQPQAPTGTFSGLSPYMPRPAAPAAPSPMAGASRPVPTMDEMKKYWIMYGLYPDGSMG